MEIFRTGRLSVQKLKQTDKEFFIELLSDPEIIHPVPQKNFSTDEMEQKFLYFSCYEEEPLVREKTIWGIYENNDKELIGLCALRTNDNNDRGIGYRLRKKYWGQGYGTEVVKGMIDYCFNSLNLNLITADVNIENVRSVKILEKLLIPAKEFYNESDKCWDRRYKLTKENWLKRQ